MIRPDHVVIRTKSSQTFLSKCASKTGLPIQPGYAEGEITYSQGIRFSNGPFIDVFENQGEPSSRPPLVAFADQVDHVHKVAQSAGWQCVIHRSAGNRASSPFPWSTLSFRRDQGILSCCFVIEYDLHALARSDINRFGALYRNNTASTSSSSLKHVTIEIEDTDHAGQILDHLGWGLIRLKPGSHPDGRPVSIEFEADGKADRLCLSQS